MRNNDDFGGVVIGTTVIDNDINSDSTKNGKKKINESTSNTNNTSSSLSNTLKKKSNQDNDNSKEGQKAKIDIKYAFGNTITVSDSVLTYQAASTSDKESNDRLLYRIGKQICVLDPENGNQQFFFGRNYNVTNVLHFSISANQKFVCMCETIRVEGKDDILSTVSTAQLSVYSLTSFNKVKTLVYPCHSDFISSTFCGDPKYIAALTG